MTDAQSVALRKESVDRNLLAVGSLIMIGGSLSARRAWIEIEAPSSAPYAELVALRKESVDRNREQFKYVVQCRVALRKESVDRNLFHDYIVRLCRRRSPQGERG